MRKKRNPPEHVHHIEVYRGQGYRIDVDGISIGQYLDSTTNTSEFGMLVPALGLLSKNDQRKAAELAGMVNVRFPVLVCGDDLDFSCIVVTASVEEAGPHILWRHFGYGLNGRKPIQAPALYFDRQNYRDFVRAFTRLSYEMG